jgi:hypothetical protein
MATSAELAGSAGGSAEPAGSARTYDIDAYNSCVTRMASESVPTYHATYGDRKVTYLLMPADWKSHAKRNQVLALPMRHSRCRTCVKRADEMASLRGPGGAVFMANMGASSDPMMNEMRELAIEIASDRSTPLVPHLVGHFPCLSEGSRNGVPFLHWTVLPDEVNSKKVNSLYTKAIQTYYGVHGGDMLTSFVAKLLNCREIADGMKILRGALGKAHNGGIYFGSTDWMIGIQTYAAKTYNKFWPHMNSEEKACCVMFALVSSNLCANSDGTVTITYYHQGNGSVMGFLENGHDEKSVIALVNSHTDPHAYQRRTTLTEGQLNVGQEKLGDFVNTVMLASDLAKYPSQLRWSAPARQSSSAGFARLRETTAPKVAEIAETKMQKAIGFASRARRKITTVRELLRVLAEGDHTLSVDCADQRPWVLAHTTLAPEKLRQKTTFDGKPQTHIWSCWKNDRLSNGWGGSASSKVLCVFQMPMGEVFFLCEGTKPASRTLGNFCYPEFLSTEMHAAKSAFEALNKVVNVTIPDPVAGDHLAVGCCASPSTETRFLVNPLTIVLDGATHTLVTFE